MKQQHLTDSELVWLAINARESREALAEAFEAIAERHRPAVLRWCSRTLQNPEAAQDVGQMTFEDAFKSLKAGKPPAEPAKLGGWLIEIAKRRRSEYLRKDQSRDWAPLPGGQAFDDWSDDDETRSGSAVRRAHALRLVQAVVYSLNDRQQQIYRLRFEEGLTGRQVAGQLAIAEKTASNEITRVQTLVAIGFGALILAQEGRPYCRGLAAILDQAQYTAVSDNFTTALRERICLHFDSCPTCDNCRTCNARRKQLTGPYVPLLIPILFGAEFRERISSVIHHETAAARPDSNNRTPRRPPPPPPAHRAPARQTLRHAKWAVPIAAAAGLALIIAAVFYGPRLLGTPASQAGTVAKGEHRTPGGSSGRSGGAGPSVPLPVNGEASFSVHPDFRPYNFEPQQPASVPVGLGPCPPRGFPVSWVSPSTGWEAAYDLSPNLGGPYDVRLYPVINRAALKKYIAAQPSSCTASGGITFVTQPTHYGKTSMLADGTDASGRATTWIDMIYADGYLIYIIDNASPNTGKSFTSAELTLKETDLQYLLSKVDRFLHLGDAFSRKTG